jgi:hypothetical protein
MPLRAPVSHHLDLYRYWLAKCGGRSMPARSDIDPADIPALLPYVSIFHEAEGWFRYRLVGTAIAEQIGRDPTGEIVGAHVSNAGGSVAAVQAIGERVFTTARPVFAITRCANLSGTIHNVSALVLPLSNGGAHVKMALFTRIARSNLDIAANIASPDGLATDGGEVVDAANILDLERRCRDWERRVCTAAPMCETFDTSHIVLNIR